jgi:hypothetical protein
MAQLAGEYVLVRVSGRGDYRTAHLFAPNGNDAACGARIAPANWDVVNPRTAGRSLVICPVCAKARRAQKGMGDGQRQAMVFAEARSDVGKD